MRGRKFFRLITRGINMNLAILTSIAEVMSIANDWTSLLTRLCTNKIHHDYDWFVAGYNVFHQGDQLYVMTVRDDQENLIGIAPLVITTGLFRWVNVRKVGFVKNDQSPANDFILAAGKEDACLKIFLDHLTTFSSWEIINLCKMNIAELSWRVLKKLIEERGVAYGIKQNIQSPYIKTDMEWNDFWNKKSINFRKSIRNKSNKANKYDCLVIDKIHVANDQASVLSEILQISANSWKHEIGNDLATREDNWRFYKEICNRFGKLGLVHVWLLKFGTVPASFEFHIQYNDVVYPLRADYDSRFKNISPGSLLEYEIIKRIFNDNTISEYNSCGHTYHYLLNWTGTTRIHENIQIFSSKLKIYLLYFIEYRLLAVIRSCRALLMKPQ